MPKGQKGKRTCTCVCKCFGFFRNQEWGFDYEKDLIDFEPGSIKILYRDKIKVFYAKVATAIQEGYNAFKDH